MQKMLKVAQESATDAAGVVAEAVTLAKDREEELAKAVQQADAVIVDKAKGVSNLKANKRKQAELLEQNDDGRESGNDTPSIEKRRRANVARHHRFSEGLKLKEAVANLSFSSSKKQKQEKKKNIGTARKTSPRPTSTRFASATSKRNTTQGDSAKASGGPKDNSDDSKMCCCGCNTDASGSNHYCLNTNKRVMAWCQVDSNEEGFKSKIICKGCKIMESGKQGDSQPEDDDDTVSEISVDIFGYTSDKKEIAEEEEQLWGVKELLKWRKVKGEIQVYIKWDTHEKSWQPESDLIDTHCEELELLYKTKGTEVQYKANKKTKEYQERSI